MLVSRTLSEIIGAEIWLKFENLQFTAAYKERGALNKLLQLTPEERARGVIAASAGNHAQAVAYHAKRLGIPGGDRHAGADADGESDPDRRPRRAGRPVRPDRRRRVHQGARAGARKGLCLHPRLRRSADHRRGGHRRPRDARRRAGPRHDRGPDRRRRAHVRSLDRGAGREAGHRADRSRGGTLSVDEMRDPGLPACRLAATRWPKALPSSSPAS